MRSKMIRIRLKITKNETQFEMQNNLDETERQKKGKKLKGTYSDNEWAVRDTK